MSVRVKERPSIYDLTRKFYRFGAKHSGDVGIEIETETKREYIIPAFSFWNSTGDGSLRDFGVEYIMKQPVKITGDNDELHASMEEFKDKTSGIKFIKDSISTSVHVHLNFLNEDFLTLANFLVAYALTENVLIRYSGPDRLSNLFCLPMCDAESTVDNCVSMLKTIKSLKLNGMVYDNNRVKYAALNLSSFARFGSLEVRSFRGETDTVLIEKWARILYKIIEFARKDHSPVDIMNSWREKKNGILEDIYEEYAYDLTQAIPKKESLEGLLVSNGWYAAKMATVTKKWEDFGIPKIKKIEKGKYLANLDAYSQRHFTKNYEALTEIEKLVVDEIALRDAANNHVVFADDEGRPIDGEVGWNRRVGFENIPPPPPQPEDGWLNANAPVNGFLEQVMANNPRR